MIEGGELVEYEACEVPISVIKQMIKNETWKGSLEEEEVLYDLQNGLYSEKYAKKVKKILSEVEK